MAKLTLTALTSSYRSNTALNANFDLIEAALENTLSRDGTAPNAMSASFDMGSQLIINQLDPVSAQDGATKIYVDGMADTIADINGITQVDGTIIVSDGTDWVGESIDPYVFTVASLNKDGSTDDRATLITALATDDHVLLPIGDIAVNAGPLNLSDNQTLRGQGPKTTLIAGSGVSHGNSLLLSTAQEGITVSDVTLKADPRTDPLPATQRQLRGLVYVGGRQNRAFDADIEVYGIGSYGFMGMGSFDGLQFNNSKVAFDDYGVLIHPSFGLSDPNDGDGKGVNLVGNTFYGRVPVGVDDAVSGGSIAAGIPTVTTDQAYDTPTSGNLDGLVGLSDGDWVVLNPPASGSVTVRHNIDVSGTPGALAFSLVDGVNNVFLSSWRRMAFQVVGGQLVHLVGGKIGMSFDSNIRGTTSVGNIVDGARNFYANGEGLGIAHAGTRKFKGHNSHAHVGNVVSGALREGVHIEDGCFNLTSVGNVFFDNEFGHRFIFGGRTSIHQRSLDPSSAVNTSTNVITDTAHGLTVEDAVYYNSTDGTDIGGLVSGTTYYAISITADTYQLSATTPAGSAINLTSTGTGTAHTFSAGEGTPSNVTLIGNTYYNIGKNCFFFEEGATTGSDTECENITIADNVMSDWGQDTASPAIRITGDGTGRIYIDGNQFRDGVGDCISFEHFTGFNSLGAASSITVGYMGVTNVTGAAFNASNILSERRILIKSGSHLSGADKVFAVGSELSAFIGDTTYKSRIMIGGVSAMEDTLVTLPANFFPLTAKITLLSDADATVVSYIKLFRHKASDSSIVDLGAAALPLASGGLTKHETASMDSILTAAFASDANSLSWSAGDTIYLSKEGNSSADGEMQFMFEINGFHYF